MILFVLEPIHLVDKLISGFFYFHPFIHGVQLKKICLKCFIGSLE